LKIQLTPNGEYNILAMDLGQSTGVAWNTDDRKHAEHWQLKVNNTEPVGMQTVRLRNNLELCVEENNIHIIAYELVRRHMGTDAAHVYGRLQGVLFEVSMTHHIPLMPLEVKQIKKFATGNGNASKEMMEEAAYRLGWTPTPMVKRDKKALSDVADAVCMLAYAHANVKNLTNLELE
jgi:Holliday junction resolvasome RuvABC endonuclease subunit